MTDELDTLFPLMASDGLPSTPLAHDFYTSQDWFQRDLERVFRRRWLFVCHISEIPAAGDYTTLEIGADSIIVARDRNGNVNAFHNTCRHRGTTICAPGRGTTRAFVCPFHNWTYNLDGTLRGAPHMPDLDKSLYAAKRVRSEVWSGMVFINMQEEPPQSVSEYFKNVDFSGHQLERTKVIAARDYMTKANWKIAGETYQECYHCTVVHGTSLGRILSDTTNHESYTNEGAQVSDGEFLIYADDLRDGAFAPGVETETLDGKYITKRLLGDGRAPQPPRLVSWFPNFSVGAFPDFAFIIDWLPVSATETKFRTRWLVHEDAVEGVDYVVDDVIELADTFNLEDKAIVERQQQGVTSSAYVPGPYHTPLEDDTRKYVRNYIDLVKTAG